jgi:hypothetical protein
VAAAEGAAAAGSNSGTRTKFAMKSCLYLSVVLCAGVLLPCLFPPELSAQSAATARLLELINSGDVDWVEEKLPRAAIDAGPPAIPYIQSVLDRSADEDRQRLALAAALYIGGDAAISLIRRELERLQEDEVRYALAIALASADTSANRRELIGMLSDKDAFDTVSAAAFSLGILRAKEAIPSLRAVPRDPSRDESEAADLALKWIEKGYPPVKNTPDNERGRAIAAVLQNGSPNIAEKDYVFDTANRGFWSHGPSGWLFNRGRPADGTQEGPTITAFIGSEGSRALVSVELGCGMLCGTRYDFVLRKEGQTWKAQMMLLVWIK